MPAKGYKQSAEHKEKARLAKLGIAPTNKKLPGEAAKNAKYYYTKYSAEKRGFTFELTFDEFERLSRQPCTYCGGEPKLGYVNPKYNGGFLHHGIDRVDNNIGYTYVNCVTCCIDCNYAKNDRTVAEFKDWIIRLANNLGLKCNSTI